MGNKLRAAIVVAVIVAATGVVTASALAKNHNSGDTKPGWGFGDKNHIHTGPPGNSDHIGPPGQSDHFDQDGDHDHGKKGDTDGDKVTPTPGKHHNGDNDNDDDH